MTQVDDDIQRSLLAVRERLELRYDNPHSADALIRQGRDAPGRAAGHRRRWLAGAAVTVVLVGAGSATAVALGVTNDGSQSAFQHLHPDKAQISDSTEQAHTTIGTVTLSSGVVLRGYVTIPAGADSCVLVDQLTRSGSSADSVSYCGRESSTTADLRIVNGALVGWVPDRSVTAVTVSGDDQRIPVVAQHFLVAPNAAMQAGDTVTLRGFAASGALEQTSTTSID